jgi:phosphoribosyl-ATP pyrophosphohydrolase
MSRFSQVLDKLAAVIASRAASDPATSWSARLIANRPLAAKKLAEEGVELALAAVQSDREAIIAEGADVIYHYIALLAATGVSLDDIATELEAREHRSGLAEKAARST